MNMLGLGNLGCNYGFTGGNALQNLFSGTNSIFGCGFNSYSNYRSCGSSGWGSMIGYTLGSFALNLVTGLLAKAINTHMTKTPTSVKSDVEELKAQLEAKTTKINNTKETLKTRQGELGPLETAKTTATTQYNATKSYVDTNKATYEALKAKTDKTAADTNFITEYEKQLNSLATLEGAKLAAEKNYEEKQKDIQALEKLIPELEEEKRTLNEKLTNAINKMNDEILNEADGYECQRTKEEKFNGKFVTNEGKTELKDDVKVTERDLRAAIAGYRNAEQGDKAAWKNKFNMIYDKLYADVTPPSWANEAKKLIK